MFKKENHTIVFDIGSKTVKVLKGNMKEEKINILDYKIFSIPENTVQQGKVIDKRILSEKLSKLKIKTKDIRLVLSSKDIILRTFELPKMGLSEIRQAVKFEMSVLLPEKIENYIIDATIIREYKETSREGKILDMHEIQGVAIEKRTVTDYLDCFSKAGLKISIVDVGPNAISKLLCFKSLCIREKHGGVFENLNFAVLDMGYEKTSITFIEDKKVFIHKTLEKGGRDFTKAIAKDFHMSFEDAEKWKLGKDFSFKKRGELHGKEEMNHLLLEIIQELGQLMEFFESMSKGKRIDCILLLGGGSLMPVCKDYIEDALHVKTECHFTLHNVNVKELSSESHINFLANAMGALMRREKK